MPLIQPNESFPERPVLIIIAGTPFSYKTSLAITSDNPVLVDGELGAERAFGRVPTFRINNWGEVESDLATGTFAPFKTVVLDTAKSILDDHMWEHALGINYTKNKQKTYGDVADIFKKFVSKIRNTKTDIVVVSHEKSKDEDDARIYDLDITGSSKQLLLRMADQVGFAYKNQLKTAGGIITQTIITFNPKKEWPFCKNVAGLPDIVLPDCHSPEWKTMMKDQIIEPTKRAIASMSDDQVAALKAIEAWREKIDATELTSEAIFAMWTEKKEIAEPHLKKQIDSYAIQWLKASGWKWQKEPAPGQFVPVEAEVKAAEPAKPAKAVAKKETVVTEAGEDKDLFAPEK